MKFLLIIPVITVLFLVQYADAQTIEITGLPTPGLAGQIVGTVTGVDFATHEVAGYVHVEGLGWYTKPTYAFPTVPINPTGAFSMSIPAVDGRATVFAVSLVPSGTVPPRMSNSSILDLGTESIASTYQIRYGNNLSFAGRNWGIKDSPFPVGPGNNRFSPDPSDVWVDQDGLHLTIHNVSGTWYSTEVVLTENLEYGTYMFQTSSRQDILNANATFGGFTWDVFGDESRIPAWPYREIDFEDTRWGNPFATNNSQHVVQPFYQPGGVSPFALPDLSNDAALTRFFTYSPSQIEFFALLGHYQPASFPVEAIIHHSVFTENLATGRVIPEPGRANFRFNLWLNQPAPVGNQPVEVVINDFQFTALVLGDLNGDGNVSNLDISAFSLALFDRAAYSLMFPGLNPDVLGDFNDDGVLDNLDTTGFAAALLGP